MKTVIVDIDGTVANCEHRQHFLRVKPRNWWAFKELAYEDTVFHDIVDLIKILHSAGNKIVFVTARSEGERDITTRWLKDKSGLYGIYEKLYMRTEEDNRDDTIIKEELLGELREDGYDPWLVLDDRDRVVVKWRELGLRCLQVAPGDF